MDLIFVCCWTTWRLSESLRYIFFQFLEQLGALVRPKIFISHTVKELGRMCDPIGCTAEPGSYMGFWQFITCSLIWVCYFTIFCKCCRTESSKVDRKMVLLCCRCLFLWSIFSLPKLNKMYSDSFCDLYGNTNPFLFEVTNPGWVFILCPAAQNSLHRYR